MNYIVLMSAFVLQVATAGGRRSSWRNPATIPIPWSTKWKLPIIATLLQFNGHEWSLKSLAAREPIRLPVCLFVCLSHLSYLSFTQNWNAVENSYFIRKLLLTLLNGAAILRSKSSWKRKCINTNYWLGLACHKPLDAWEALHRFVSNSRASCQRRAISDND